MSPKVTLTSAVPTLRAVNAPVSSSITRMLGESDSNLTASSLASSPY